MFLRSLLFSTPEAKKEKLINAEELAKLNFTQRLEKCRELFSDNSKLVIASPSFSSYGSKEPYYSNLAYFFGRKTNQVYNIKAATITPQLLQTHPEIKDKKFIPIPYHVLDVFKSLCDLKDLYDDIVKNKRTGDTTKLIADILTHYQLPTDAKEFALIKQLFDEVLTEKITIAGGKQVTCFLLFNYSDGILPLQTLSVLKSETPSPR